jgi:excisionase family DNA binding protein
MINETPLLSFLSRFKRISHKLRYQKFAMPSSHSAKSGMASTQLISPEYIGEHYTTKEVAQMLGLAVRSVQLMVDRGDLEAWKTPGGHRRISRASVDRWLTRRTTASNDTLAHAQAPVAGQARVLIIEDSVHYQKLVSLLLTQRFPDVQWRIADEGIAGLAMAGEWHPDVLIVDILLPGIDGATLITSLRTHRQFNGSQLIVMTSLDDAQRAPYAFALQDVPVIHKPNLVAQLPSLLAKCLANIDR